LQDWLDAAGSDATHELALQRIASLPKRRPRHILTSVGRLVAQKASLLLHDDDAQQSPLEQIAGEIGRDGAIIILGSGEATFEERMQRVAERCTNVVFVRGYSETLADPLYHAGDLFLMPSSFEPCGISQMLAMRRGQPVVAHAVGGLRDTIRHRETGFLFGGDTPAQQADNFVTTTLEALAERIDDPLRWQGICKAAAAMRFDWATAARHTIDELYEH
jgi:starch synthase